MFNLDDDDELLFNDEFDDKVLNLFDRCFFADADVAGVVSENGI